MTIILGLDIPEKYVIIFYLTLVVILVKIIMAIYLAVRLRRSKKEENPVAPIFMSSIMWVMVLWTISRIFFMIFDFILTQFNTAYYGIFPNPWFWKFGAMFASIGVIVVLWIIDRKILGNKFKGIFAIIMLASLVLMMLYPVNNFTPDFQTASLIGLVGSLMAFLIPILFLYIGIKTPGLRKTAFLLAFGIIIYVLGGGLVSAAIIEIFTNAGMTQELVYLISTSMKIVGLLMITVGATRFRF